MAEPFAWLRKMFGQEESNEPPSMRAQGPYTEVVPRSQRSALENLSEAWNTIPTGANIFLDRYGEQDAKFRKENPETAKVMDTVGLMTMGVPGPALGALWGVPKNLYFHGTSSALDKESILREGFTAGSSSELKLPGVSLSTDPFVSFKRFAAGHPERMVQVRLNPEEVRIRNLSPKEYLTFNRENYRNLQKEVGDRLVVRKPNSYFAEDETFLPATYGNGYRGSVGKFSPEKEFIMSPKNDPRILSIEPLDQSIINFLRRSTTPTYSPLAKVKNPFIDLSEQILNASGRGDRRTYLERLPLTLEEIVDDLTPEQNSFLAEELSKVSGVTFPSGKLPYPGWIRQNGILNADLRDTFKLSPEKWMNFIESSYGKFPDRFTFGGQ